MHQAQYQPTERTCYLTAKQMKEKYQITHPALERLAQESGTKIKIGKSVRYDDKRFEAYFLTLAVQ